jgi:ribonuclease HII
MIIVGIDEVGRGCWAGPLVAGAVILTKPINGLRDSKLLSKRQRKHLDVQIKDSALAYGLGWVDPKQLDAVGLTEAVRLAMTRALDQIEIAYDKIIIDGKYNFLNDISKTEAIVRADNLVSAVSAASVIAKVARDDYMSTVAALRYPHYGFESHVGYGTALHISNLEKYGTCEIHRLSFRPVKLIAELASSG